jgi:hypothetical protein
MIVVINIIVIKFLEKVNWLFVTILFRSLKTKIIKNTKINGLYLNAW